ncbi:MAG: LysM peptidoglycan-binding domain-containing protein [Candidatus Nanopelagicales bacterium]
MFPFLGPDPVTSSWMIALAGVFVLAVAIPLLRFAVALCIHAYAALSGRHHLHRTASMVMPRTAQLIGSLVIGVTSIAAPAMAAGHDASLSSVNLDRDAGAGASAASATRSHAVTTAAQPHINLDRDAGAGQVAPSHAPATAKRNLQHASRTHQPAPATHRSAGDVYVVRTGDSLWSIAQEHLEHPTNSDVTDAWKAIWRANRTVIGDHPELIRPGQELRMPPGALA